MSRTATVAVTLALVLATATACSNSGSDDAKGSGTGAASGAASGTSKATETPSATQADPAALAKTVKRVVIAKADLHAGDKLQDRPGGTKVEGEVTLDYCGAGFASEAARTARYQIDIIDTHGGWRGSNEAVAYAPGKAAEALNELRTALTDCPEDQYVDSAVEGTPAMRFTSFPLQEADLTNVADDHVATKITYTEKGGSSSDSYTIFQRRGDVLIGSYSDSKARAIELANAAGKRLAAADPADVGE